MRAVLDPNVLVSALISPAGPPREIAAAWVQGRFELIASPALLGELGDVLARPKFRRWVSAATAAEFVDGLLDAALVIEDPPTQPGLSRDPDDDYLVTLACAANADYVISGDRHLIGSRRPDPTCTHATPVPGPADRNDRVTPAAHRRMSSRSNRARTRHAGAALVPARWPGPLGGGFEDESDRSRHLGGDRLPAGERGGSPGRRTALRERPLRPIFWCSRCSPSCDATSGAASEHTEVEVLLLEQQRADR